MQELIGKTRQEAEIILKNNNFIYRIEVPGMMYDNQYLATRIRVQLNKEGIVQNILKG